MNLKDIDFAEQEEAHVRSFVAALSEDEIIRAEEYDRYHTVDLIIPKGIKAIEAKAFQRYPNLKTVRFEEEGALEVIEREAFLGCEELESVVLPKSVRFIGDSAFENCKKLTSVTIDKDNRLEFIGRSAFARQYVVGKPRPSTLAFSERLNFLGDCAFRDCPLFEKVDFSRVTSLEKIPYEAFRKAWVKKVIMPACGCISEIDSYAFATIHLTEVVILANGLTYIGQSAFQEAKLKRFDFNGVRRIEAFAFCHNLDLKAVTVPMDCEMGKGAFPIGCKVTKKDLPVLSAGGVSEARSGVSGEGVLNKLKGFLERLRK